MLLVRQTSANSVPIVDLAKELAKDPEALSRLKMERTAYGYKLEHGVAKTFEDDTIACLQKVALCVDIDDDPAALTLLGIGELPGIQCGLQPSTSRWDTE